MVSKINTGAIKENKQIVGDFYVLTFEWKGEAPRPGQFINLQVPGFFLKRPFAVFDYSNDGYLSILYKKVGKGTEVLSTLEKNTKIEILGILGKHFEIPREFPVLIGGGTGIASLYYFAKTLQNKKIILGLNQKEEALAFQKLFENVGEITISTMDGSHGFPGNAIDCAVSFLQNFDSPYSLYACGPHKMLLSLNEMIKNQKISPTHTYVSLEERMGCGFGVCLGCAVEKKDKTGFAYVCKDGPIFKIDEIDWDAF